MGPNQSLLSFAQFCEGILPLALTTARTGRVVSLKNYRRCLVLLYKGIGTASDDPNITILQGTDIAFGTNKALNFTTIYVKQDLTKLSDVGQWTKVTQAAGNTYTDATSAEQAALWAIDFKAEDLDIANNYDCIRAAISDVGTNAQLGCVLMIPYDPVFEAAPQDMLSAIAD
jgi:hypothetical protein